MIEAVIFDLDGTLLNSLEDLCDSVNFVMKQEGYPTRTLEEVRTFVGTGVYNLIRYSLPEGTSKDEIMRAVSYTHLDVYKRQAVGHVGIVVGDGMMIDASSSNGEVVYRTYNSSWCVNSFVCGRRPW